MTTESISSPDRFRFHWRRENTLLGSPARAILVVIL